MSEKEYQIRILDDEERQVGWTRDEMIRSLQVDQGDEKDEWKKLE